MPATACPPPAPGVSARDSRVTRRLVRLLDALARGASPPGMIDIVHNRHSHLHRRITMIARYDGSNGRWSAAGLALSLFITVIALTGAVRGQDAAPAPDAPPAPDAAGAPAPPAPAAPPQSRVAPAARDVKAEARPAPVPGFGAADAARLWEEKYVNRIYYVDGRVANKQQVDKDYVEELQAVAGSEAAASRLLKQAAARLQHRPEELRPPVPAHEPVPAQQDVPAVAEGEDEDVDPAVLARLDQKLEEMNFAGAPLADVIDFLRDVAGVNVVVEWGQLESAGIDRNAPVTLRVKNVKFGRALDLVLSGAAAGVPLGYAVDGNVIRISTRDHLDSVTAVRVYDVRDIIASEVQVQDLTQLITESVDPDSWRDSGGSVGVIRPTRNKLVVTQTPMNHREIRSLLQKLREQPTEPARAADAASAAQAPARSGGR